MADTTVGVKLTADGSQVITSVKSIKTELRLAEQQVVAMNAAFGATSKEAAAAAQKAAQLKDQIGDAKSLVDAFNPDTKFRAFGSAINTVVGGFTALTGVMGLVGAKSEETEKLLLKVQSALAISQGISQLQEGIQSFKNLNAVIQASTVFQKLNAAATAITAGVMRLLGISALTTGTAFNVLKGIIVSTGIGALVVGIGLLINKISDWTSSTDDAADAQKRLKSATDDLNSSFERQQNFIDLQGKKERLRAELAGASAKELEKIDDRTSARRIKNAERSLEEAKFNGVDLAEFEGKLNAEKDRDEIRRLDASIKRKKEAAQAAKLIAEKAAAAEIAAAAELARNKGRVEDPREALKRIGGLKIEIPKTEKQLQLEAETDAMLKNAATNQATKELITNTDKEFTRIHDENIDQRMANEQAEFSLREAIANSTISILGSLSDLVGRQTTAGKVLALAEIAAGTAKGLMNALIIAQQSAKGTGTAAVVAFPIFYITQLAAVLAAAARAKAIIGSSGGGGSTSVSAASVSAPLTPQRAQQESTTLDQKSLNALGSATTRAYFLESDVEGVEKVRRLNRMARIA